VQSFDAPPGSPYAQTAPLGQQSVGVPQNSWITPHDGTQPADQWPEFRTHAPLRQMWQLFGAPHSVPSFWQIVSSGARTSPGQLADEPVQVSAGSQTALAPPGRHSYDEDRNPFAGQPGDEPVQCSATSHTPADARHS
jgi:hypothetical protein